MRDHIDSIRQLGGDVAAVGTGDARYAAAFRDEHGIDFPLLLDPELATYAAVGTDRARATTFLRPGQAAKAAVAAVRRGQGRTGPHPLRLGATHVIAPDGAVPYAWVNADLGDDAPLDEVCGALRGQAA